MAKRSKRFYDLTPGMTLIEDIVCGRKKTKCDRHSKGEIIVRGGVPLTDEHIRKIRDNVGCIYSEYSQKFSNVEALDAFIKAQYERKEEYKQCLVIRLDEKGAFLNTMEIQELNAMSRSNKEKILNFLVAIYGTEPEFMVEVPEDPEKRKAKVEERGAPTAASGITENEIEWYKEKTRSIVKEIHDNIVQHDSITPELSVSLYKHLETVESFFSRVMNVQSEAFLVTARDTKYKDIMDHSVKVAFTCAQIAQNIGTMRRFVSQIFVACLFMDIGLIRSIKEGDYTRHPERSCEYFEMFLHNVKQNMRVPMASLKLQVFEVFLEMGKLIILNHHRGARGTRTLEYDRLAAIVDRFYHLTDTINYHLNGEAEPKQGMTNIAAINILENETLDGKYEAVDFDRVRKFVFPYPIHTIIDLDTFGPAIVIDNRNDRWRPKVYLFFTRDIMDLSEPGKSNIRIRNQVVNSTRSTGKGTVPARVAYAEKNNSIQFSLYSPQGEAQEGIHCPCPNCGHLVCNSLPTKIAKEIELVGDCRELPFEHLRCDDGHFCILSIEPPGKCLKRVCKTPRDCSINDWKLKIEAFYVGG